MDVNWQDMIAQIHDSGRRAVLALTGGGTGAIAELLRVPGGSRLLLDAVVPYELRALCEFLGRDPEHACSEATAAAMANRALERARRLTPDHSPLVGVGVTASLATDRPKQGDHRCHIATADERGVELVSVVLEKGARDRPSEEDLVSRAAVVSLARACGVTAPDVAALLGPHDRLMRQSLPALGLISQLVDGWTDRVTLLPDGQLATGLSSARCVLPGSFNPLHPGHLGLAQAAAELLGSEVSFEFSVINVDKPPLAAADVRRRVAQFAWRASVQLTRAATFREKARVLPGVTFVVGADTAQRIVQPKYYGGSETDMWAALQQIASHGCRFLVAGRADAGGQFRTLVDIAMPEQFAHLFTPIPESRFRLDISSTGLRRHGEQ
jgi:nicotinic acid mononucleotide adenylyltransferase/nicotinamide mononucleotide (NMN) deamidase PncC